LRGRAGEDYRSIRLVLPKAKDCKGIAANSTKAQNNRLELY